MTLVRRVRSYAGGPLLMAELTDRLAALHGDRVAVRLDRPLPYQVCAQSRLTYHDIHRLTTQLAAVLADTGVRATDRVAIATANQFDFLLLCLAVMRIGAVAVPLNHLLKRDEIIHIVEQASAGTLILDRTVCEHAFSDGELPQTVVRALFAGAATDAPVWALSIDAALTAEPAPASAAATQAETVCAILYTSGTSGHPRGAIHTSGGLLCRMQLAMLYPASKRDLIVVALPLAHIMGIVAVLLPLLAGAAIYFLPEFHPLRVLEAIERNGATMFVGVPAMYRLMADAGIDRFDLSSIRAWISAADAMPPDLVDEFRKRGALFRARPWRRPAFFVDAYGSVELGGAVMACVSLPLAVGRGGSRFGILLPHCRARICDDDGRRVPRGTIGELWIKCPSAFRGYVDTVRDETLRSDGWVRTGDLAYRSRTGLVRFVERKKDVIKSGGYSVFPAEIERVLAAHEAIAQAVVFGVPHPTRITAPAAVVTLASSANTSTEALIAYSRTQLADYKALSGIVVVDAEEIPYGPTRKIARDALARRFGSHTRRWLPTSLPELSIDRPLTLVLGGGGIRGLAHLGVIDALAEAGFEIAEIVGSSVGALVVAYYAVVGLDVPAMRDAGLSVTSRNLMTWAVHRRMPRWIQRRWQTGTGIIPDYLDRLTSASFDRLHHGVQRVGIVAKDLLSGEQIVCHSDDPIVSVDEIVRGAVAVPGVFPPRVCRAEGRELALADGASLLPIEVAFQAPFRPRQIVAVDISSRTNDRIRNRGKVERLRVQHPHVPIEVLTPEVAGKPTLIYGSHGLAQLIEAGRSAAAQAIPSATRARLAVPLREAL